MSAAKTKAVGGRQGKVLLIQGGTILGVILAWEAVGKAMPEVAMFFPPIEDILGAGWNLVSSGYLNTHLATTGYELLWGIVLGAGLGILAGTILGSSRFFGGVLEPYVNYLATVPKIIVYPIFILFLGIGVGSKIGMGAASAFFPIAINTMAGIHEVNPVLVRVARTMGAGTFQVYTKVYLPAIVGPIVAGLRVGVGVVVIGTLMAETKIAKAGIGYEAIAQYENLMFPEMYSTLVIIFGGAMILNWVLSTVHSRVTRYRRGAGEGGSL